MNPRPQKALVDVEEIDLQTKSVPLSIDAILSSVDAAAQALANATTHQLDPKDRASLLAFAEMTTQAARSLSSAGVRLHEQAARLEAAGLLAYHRAPLPKQKALGRSRR
jgi:hypothetical protein